MTLVGRPSGSRSMIGTAAAAADTAITFAAEAPAGG